MKAVILEDEELNAERLVQLLKQVVPEVEVVGMVESVADGVAWFSDSNNYADVIFMDIQLSDGNCFEIFNQVQVRTPIIFTTAYDKFALQAFKVHSVDYLLKPIDSSDLRRALEKLSYFRDQPNQHFDVTKIAEAFYKKENTRFLGKTNNQLVYVKAKDIAYVYFSDGITKAVTFDSQKVPLDYSLDQMEKMLNRVLFFRINRKMIIHIDAIKKINTYYNSRLVLQLVPGVEKDTVVSRERVNIFKSWLEGRE